MADAPTTCHKLLERVEGPEGRVTTIKIGHHSFAVTHFEGHGIEVLGLGRDAGQLWVQDPDGNVIELIVPPRGASPSE